MNINYPVPRRLTNLVVSSPELYDGPPLPPEGEGDLLLLRPAQPRHLLAGSRLRDVGNFHEVVAAAASSRPGANRDTN